MTPRRVATAKPAVSQTTSTAPAIITCGMCGAFCLEDKATPFLYNGAEAKACPRCWAGVQAHSADTGQAT